MTALLLPWHWQPPCLSCLIILCQPVFTQLMRWRCWQGDWLMYRWCIGEREKHACKCIHTRTSVRTHTPMEQTYTQTHMHPPTPVTKLSHTCTCSHNWKIQTHRHPYRKKKKKNVSYLTPVGCQTGKDWFLTWANGVKKGTKSKLIWTNAQPGQLYIARWFVTSNEKKVFFLVDVLATGTSLDPDLTEPKATTGRWGQAGLPLPSKSSTSERMDRWSTLQVLQTAPCLICTTQRTRWVAAIITFDLQKKRVSSISLWHLQCCKPVPALPAAWVFFSFLRIRLFLNSWNVETIRISESYLMIQHVVKTAQLSQ